MAEHLDDGEFWLPSHFLTDDDILMDFDFKHDGSASTSASDLDFTSGCTETESDEDDILLARLTHQMSRSNLHDSSCPVHSSKGWVLSSSPQSTLCGCVCNQSSSRESGSVSVSPPPQRLPHEAASVTSNDGELEKNNNDNATLDLLNKAAGEVARLKTRSEKKSTSIGTGFFDCSQKGVSYPPPLLSKKNLDQFPPLHFQPHFVHSPPPPMIWALSNGIHQYNQPKQQPAQNRATKNDNKKNNNANNNNNRPLGLPPSAWPPLQAQVPTKSQAQVPAQAQPVFVGPKSACAGTGVFLPRRVATPATENGKKSGENATKVKSRKASQSQSNNRRNFSQTWTTPTTTTVKYNDIELPQEWTY